MDQDPKKRNCCEEQALRSMARELFIEEAEHGIHPITRRTSYYESVSWISLANSTSVDTSLCEHENGKCGLPRHGPEYVANRLHPEPPTASALNKNYQRNQMSKIWNNYHMTAGIDSYDRLCLNHRSYPYAYGLHSVARLCSNSPPGRELGTMSPRAYSHREEQMPWIALE